MSQNIDEGPTLWWPRFGQYRNFPEDKKKDFTDAVMTYEAKTWALAKHREKKTAVAKRCVYRSLLLNLTRKNYRFEMKLQGIKAL